MDNEKKAGIICIIVGICISLLALPFVEGYSEKKGFFENLIEVGIPIKKGSSPSQSSPKPVKTEGEPGKTFSYHSLIPKKIPFRYFLAVTFIFLYAGFIKIDRSRRRNKEIKNGHQDHKRS